MRKRPSSECALSVHRWTMFFLIVVTLPLFNTLNHESLLRFSNGNRIKIETVLAIQERKCYNV